MDVLKTLKPGDNGTKRLTRRYGDQLLFVRYRRDRARNRRYTTVELIVDEGPIDSQVGRASTTEGPVTMCEPFVPLMDSDI